MKRARRFKEDLDGSFIEIPFSSGIPGRYCLSAEVEVIENRLLRYEKGKTKQQLLDIDEEERQVLYRESRLENETTKLKEELSELRKQYRELQYRVGGNE